MKILGIAFDFSHHLLRTQFQVFSLSSYQKYYFTSMSSYYRNSKTVTLFRVCMLWAVNNSNMGDLRGEIARVHFKNKLRKIEEMII